MFSSLLLSLYVLNIQKGATLLKHHPLNPAAFSADSVIPEWNRIWGRQHEDLANPLLRTWVILLKILCIHTGLNTVGTARVKRINLTESDPTVSAKREDLELFLKVKLGCRLYRNIDQQFSCTLCPMFCWSMYYTLLMKNLFFLELENKTIQFLKNANSGAIYLGRIL